jgi:hypothetical protein
MSARVLPYCFSQASNFRSALARSAADVPGCTHKSKRRLNVCAGVLFLAIGHPHLVASSCLTINSRFCLVVRLADSR